MNNVIYELIKYGHCSDINDLNNTIDKLTELINSLKVDKLKFNIVEYLQNIKNNYTQYITKIIDKYSSNSNNDDIKYNFDIFDDEIFLMSFGIIVDDNIPYNNSYISAYSLLKNIKNKFDEDNLKIYTDNMDDYVACYLCLLNIIYDHGGGKDITDILVNSYDNIYLNNAIYISSTYKIYNHNVEIQNMFTLMSIDVANNINNNSKEYKQLILSMFVPVKIYFEFIKDNYIGIKLQYSPSYSENRLFTLNDINDVVYYRDSDWSKPTQTLINGNNELLNKLCIYEENMRHINEIMNIKNNISSQWLHDDIVNKFNYLSLTKKLTSVNIRIGDILKPIRSGGTNNNTIGTKYPYITSINTNNGIVNYVDKYDTRADKDNPIMSIGTNYTGKGYAYVHTYDFAHSPCVILFMMKTDSINIYNLSFSITNHLTNLTLPKYISSKYILTQYIDVIASDKMLL